MKVQLTEELVKCTLLLNRLLALRIYCCVVGVNIVANVQRLWVWYWLCAEYSEGAVDSRTGKVYIAVKQSAGPTDILLCCLCKYSSNWTGILKVQKTATEFWIGEWLKLRFQRVNTKALIDKPNIVSEEHMAWAFLVNVHTIQTIFLSSLKRVRLINGTIEQQTRIYFITPILSQISYVVL